MLTQRVGLATYVLIRASSRKLQALKPQATSFKPQATSVKLQAASDKLPDSQALIKFQATSIMGLDYNKTVDWMFHVERNLMRAKSNLFTFCNLEFYSKKVPRSIIAQ